VGDVVTLTQVAVRLEGDDVLTEARRRENVKSRQSSRSKQRPR
jgi:hypothetical protein